MLGTYKVNVLIDNVIRYEFILERQFTIVCGYSGTGKTVLCNFIQMHFTEKDNDRVKIVITPEFNTSEVPIVRAITMDLLSANKNSKKYDDGSYKLKWAKKPKNSIIFVDEDYAYLRGIGFAAATKYSDAYYVVLARDTRLSEYLNDSVLDFIQFKEIGNNIIENKAVKMYSEYSGITCGYGEEFNKDSCSYKIDELVNENKK